MSYIKLLKLFLKWCSRLRGSSYGFCSVYRHLWITQKFTLKKLVSEVGIFFQLYLTLFYSSIDLYLVSHTIFYAFDLVFCIVLSSECTFPFFDELFLGERTLRKFWYWGWGTECFYVLLSTPWNYLATCHPLKCWIDKVTPWFKYQGVALEKKITE